eukprot:TRINITY_DN709_c5_g1_i2.p1 TRINITY_DN709_c5_g1~~TRINITY_DN709_c5_g1_i2.p1  ORF type:complete len:563 (-),score=165.05 TRINITY_DN709_c5_g1_i2:16-1704(-)
MNAASGEVNIRRKLGKSTTEDNNVSSVTPTPTPPLPLPQNNNNPSTVNNKPITSQSQPPSSIQSPTQSSPLPSSQSYAAPPPPSSREKETAPSPLIYFQANELEREFPHIARGSFGTVYRGTAKGIPGVVVIKDIDIINHQSITDWQRELSTMSNTQNPYIVKLFGYSSTNKILTIVMEYVVNSDLFSLLHKNRMKQQQQLSFLQRLRMARHIALALQFIHSHNIMHRDIKSMNILVTEDYKCKLTDFGCAKFIIGGGANNENPSIFQTSNSGTPFWMAPEVKRGNYYSFSADIYSLGVVFYELFELSLPLYDESRSTILLPNHTFQSSSVVLPCLHINPLKRPTASQVVEVLNSMFTSMIMEVKKYYIALSPSHKQELELILSSSSSSSSSSTQCDGEGLSSNEIMKVYWFLSKKQPSFVDSIIHKVFDFGYSNSQSQSPSPSSSFLGQQQQQQPVQNNISNRQFAIQAFTKKLMANNDNNNGGVGGGVVVGGGGSMSGKTALSLLEELFSKMDKSLIYSVFQSLLPPSSSSSSISNVLVDQQMFLTVYDKLCEMCNINNK